MITTLDPTTALIVIDLQMGLAKIPVVHPMAGVVANAAALAKAFRAKGLPVALVNVAGGAPGRTDQPARIGTLPPEALVLMPELDVQPSDILVTKWTRGAFTGTALDLHLRRRGVTQVVVVGVATSAGVESTVRHAQELNYHVTVAIDAVTDRSAEAHQNSVERIFPAIAETGTTADILGKLG